MIRSATISPDAGRGQIEPWVSPREAAAILGEDEDVIREKMRVGMIRARNIARPGQARRQWRTTGSWLTLYQQTSAVAGVPGPSGAASPAKLPETPTKDLRHIPYSKFKRLSRAEQDAYLQEIAMRGSE